MMKSLRVLKVSQPIGEFYIGSIESRDLIEISTVEIREFLQGNPDDLAGIQRKLSKSRLKELAEYVNYDFATFPTAVVLAIDERCVRIEEIDGCEGLFEMIVEGYEGLDESDTIPLGKSALVIDGQHRLAGLEHLNGEKSFDVNVSIFVGVDIADKAEIFSKVNMSQTKVNKSLVYDLFSYASNPSPYKSAHEVAIALNKDEEGPFYRKIKRLGTATPGFGKVETLTQATVVEGMLRYFPKNPDLEKNKGFLGMFQEEELGEDWRVKIFSPFYRKGDSVPVFQIMTSYFRTVQNKWPTAWNDVEEGFILNRTNGYNALMRFLPHAYNAVVTENPRVVKQSEFDEVFSKIHVQSNELVSDNFKPGSSGASELYKRFLKESGL